MVIRMKKKYLALLLAAALLADLTACGWGAEADGKQNSGWAAGINGTSAEIGGSETGSENGSGSETGSENGGENSGEVVEGTVLVYLPAERVIGSGEQFYNRTVFERDRYGSIIRATEREEKGDKVLSTRFTAQVHEDDVSYNVDTPYIEGNYDLTFDENGRLISAQAQRWTLTYSDQDGSAYKEVSHDKDYKYTYVRYYDAAYRLTDSYGYDFGSDAVKYEHHYTYDDQGREIEERQIHHKNNYDFTSTYTVFCETGRPLEFFYVAGSRGDYELRTTLRECTCTYDSAGRVLTEEHMNPNGKVMESYEYAYDTAGNVIQIVEKDLGDYSGGDEIYHFDADGNLIRYDRSYTILFQPYQVVDDPLLLAFLELRDEGIYEGSY